MRKIEMNELKAIALDILKSIAEFCDKNNLRYYLAYGTMLGAVRHKGFIPWDDDIDIMMPRPDYMKFIKAYNGFNKNYQVCSIELDKTYTYTMAKVFDKRTTLDDFTLWKSYKHGGMFVDIFPVDGLPDNKTDQTKVFNHQQLLNLLFHGSCMKYAYSHKYVDSKSSAAELKGLIRTILKFGAVTIMHPLPTARLIRKINEDAQKHPYGTSNFKSVLVDCASGNKREVLPTRLFVYRKKYKFEDSEFWGFEDYDFYLSHLFNNYMEMPPVDRRVPHHNFAVYWKN